LQEYISETLTSLFHSNSRKIDDFTLYIHESKKALSVNYVGRIISYMDIQNGPWSRMLDTPTNMYFKQEADGIFAFHSMNRFEDHKLLGGLAVRINRKVWDEVGTILESEAASSVFLSNDEGELLSGTKNKQELGDIPALLKSLAVPDSGLSIQKTNNYYFFMQ
jgi:two-component system sensor histidine kinase YesM